MPYALLLITSMLWGMNILHFLQCLFFLSVGLISSDYNYHA